MDICSCLGRYELYEGSKNFHMNFSGRLWLLCIMNYMEEGSKNFHMSFSEKSGSYISRR